MNRLVRQILVKAPVERVFAALTEPEQMRIWLAEGVEVDLRPGGAYRFWGSSVFKGEVEATARQAIREVTPPTKLVVDWPWVGMETVLAYSLTPLEDGCVVRMTHDVPLATDELNWYLATDQAYTHLYNLREYVETGKPADLPFYDHNPDTASLRVTISASPEDVWAALTTPELMDKWVSSKAEVDLRVDGRYSYGWEEGGVPHGPQRLLEVVPGRRITHDWSYSDEPDTQATWEVVPEDGGCLLKLTHSGFGGKTDVDNYVQGWAAFLCAIKALVEGKSLVEKFPDIQIV